MADKHQTPRTGQTKSVSECLDEIARAAQRLRDEAVRLTYIHDGTPMALVPDALLKRLEAAVADLEATGEY